MGLKKNLFRGFKILFWVSVSLFVVLLVSANTPEAQQQARERIAEENELKAIAKQRRLDDEKTAMFWWAERDVAKRRENAGLPPTPEMLRREELREKRRAQDREAQEEWRQAAEKRLENARRRVKKEPEKVKSEEGGS